MASAPTHRFVNFAVTATYLSSQPKEKQRGLAHPLLGASASALLARLPDILEPAHNPHHRQFFHSLAFASVLGYGLYRAYEWEPDAPMEELARSIALICGSAYLLHLAADFMTARSLPLIGK